MTLREQIKAASAKEMAARIAWEANPLRNTLQPMIAAKAEYQHLLMLADRAGMLLVIEDDADAVRRMAEAIAPEVFACPRINLNKPAYDKAHERATAALAALRGEG